MRHRPDSNKAELVRQIRQLPGVSVIDWNGLCDLILGYRKMTFLIEIKPNAKAKLRPSQKKLLETWTGQYAIVTSLDDILRLLNAPGIRTQTNPSP